MAWSSRCVLVGTALAVLTLSSGCAVRPVLRGELTTLSLTGVTAAELEGGGGGAPRAKPVAVAETPPAAKTEAVAPSHDVAAGTLVAQRSDAAATPAATTPAAPAVTRVRVTVRARDEAAHYEVEGGAGQKCRLPCTLDLAPGSNLLSFDGDVKVAHWVEVPAHGGTLEVEFVGSGRRTAAWVLGGAGFVVGGVGMALAPILGGVPLLILGGVGLALLIPALIIGFTSSDTLTWVAEPPR